MGSCLAFFSLPSRVATLEARVASLEARSEALQEEVLSLNDTVEYLDAAYAERLQALGFTGLE